jgi:hypothetical protein
MRLAALAVVLVSLAFWAARGANMGWTKTSVPTRTLDEVTGIESVAYQKRLVPGVDFLGGVLLGAGLLVATSFFMRNTTVSS